MKRVSTLEWARTVAFGSRLLVALAIGVVAALLTLRYLALHFPANQASDLTPIYLGAQYVLQGVDQYSAVAGRSDVWLHLLLYPLPTSLAVVPLLPFPMHIAGALLLGLGTAWLAYHVTREAWWPLLVFVSGGFWWSIVSVQWTPLLMAAALAGPPVGLALAVKPTYGLALLAMQRRWKPVVWGLCVAAGIILVSLAIQPRWPLSYYRTVTGSPIRHEYVAPAFTLLGSPLWLALLRWRDWRGRLVIGMAVSPLNALGYSHLPLLLVARTRIEMLSLVMLSWGGYFLSWRVIDRIAHGPTFAPLTPPIQPIAVAFYYLPALFLCLRHATNDRLAETPSRQLASHRRPLLDSRGAVGELS